MDDRIYSMTWNLAMVAVHFIWGLVIQRLPSKRVLLFRRLTRCDEMSGYDLQNFSLDHTRQSIWSQKGKWPFKETRTSTIGMQRFLKIVKTPTTQSLDLTLVFLDCPNQAQIVTRITVSKRGELRRFNELLDEPGRSRQYSNT